VFIGASMDRAAIELQLDSALLSDAGVQHGPAVAVPAGLWASCSCCCCCGGLAEFGRVPCALALGGAAVC
jgi:hypothetical protein